MLGPVTCPVDVDVNWKLLSIIVSSDMNSLFCQSKRSPKTMELMTLETARLRKKVGSMKAPGRGEGEGIWGKEGIWSSEVSVINLGTPSPNLAPFPGQNKRVHVGCLSPLFSGVCSSPRVSRKASRRKPASSWTRSSMPRLPKPKSRSVEMEKCRSCLLRSPLLRATPGEGGWEW